VACVVRAEGAPGGESIVGVGLAWTGCDLEDEKLYDDVDGSPRRSKAADI
jgi:hypothetical protein